MGKVYKVALLGFGTVGKGTYRSITVNAAEIKRRTGLDIEVSRILELKEEAINCGIAPKEIFTQDINDILNDPEIVAVAEIIGGKEPAATFMLQAMAAGKNVVTPNKALVAARYDEFKAAAEKYGVEFRYEAAVGGAIPVIETINRSLWANSFNQVQGIVNGTTNYILTKMDEENMSYEEALKQAQAKGFAEQDPTADVEGIDTANKLTILMAEAFGVYMPPTEFERVGITGVTKADLEAAAAKNCKIKLIANAERQADGTIKASVKPTEIPCDNPLAGVRNEFNAILLRCNMADDIFLEGRGAGQDPTGSAMASDLIAICVELAK
ncbi:MAG: homoserine dehydrogenase [Eubacteriales bacterium]|nr:homoserine dehydrogenase [Eubacteriales bacterium]